MSQSKFVFLLVAIFVVCNSAESNVAAQSNHTARSTILKLPENPQLKKLTAELYETPMRAIEEVFRNDFPELASIRTAMRKNPENRLLAAEYESKLSPMLSAIDLQSGRLLAGESQVKAELADNIRISAESKGLLESKIAKVDSKISKLETEANLRHGKLRRLVEVYGDRAELPADMHAAAEKIRADLQVLSNLKHALELRRGEHMKEAKCHQELVSSLKKYKRQVQIAFHVIRGHRVVLAHIAELRSAKISRSMTAERSNQLRTQLARLIQDLHKLKISQFAESALDVGTESARDELSQTSR